MYILKDTETLYHTFRNVAANIDGFNMSWCPQEFVLLFRTGWYHFRINYQWIVSMSIHV